MTERGKIVIAVILVMVCLVLPAIVLAVWAWTGSSPPPEPPPQSAEPLPDEPPPYISNGPLPNGSGLDPHDPPDLKPPEINESGSADPPPEHDDYDLEYGPIYLNVSEGTMLFSFSPELQDSLDNDTALMLGDFLASPKNTTRAQVMVEMPNLSGDDTTALISAVSNALAQHGVTQENIVYLTQLKEAEERFFEVKLSFYVAPSRK
jgi:hypothetical protein